MAGLFADTDTSAQPDGEFFLARQPILDRSQDLIAYELLFRHARTTSSNANNIEATAAVIEHASELGLENVVGDSLGFVNVDTAALLSDLIEVLPCDKMVLEILETVKATDQVVARVQELKDAGYKFALDDVVADTEDVRRLLPMVDVIKVDICGMADDVLEDVSHRFSAAGKKILAEKVESIEQFQYCLDLGFDYFQGYYFARPAILSGRKLTPAQTTLLRLMNLLNSDAENTEIEHAIKHEASLSLSLLRMANSPALGTGQRILSLNQALMVLGRRQLQRWIQILLYAAQERPAGTISPLLTLAVTRGKLLELMAEKFEPGNHKAADTAFMVGIMSLMDVLFATPMEKLLTHIQVAPEVQEALLKRAGTYGKMLRVVEYLELLERSSALLTPALRALPLSIGELQDMQIAAFAWSNEVSRQA